MLWAVAETPTQRSLSMGQQNNGCATGCGTLLVLMALGVVLAYWSVFLAIGLVTLLIYALALPGLQQKQRQLKALVEGAQRRVRQDPCQVREHFGIVQSITLAGDLFTPRITIFCRTIANTGNQLDGEERCISLSPPPDPQLLRSSAGVVRWLREGGIVLFDDLSVEAKATRAAMECLRERSWTKEALDKLVGLRTSVVETLGKARGNELLEPSIPQLQQALGAFEQEQRKLEQANRSAAEMLRKLNDFLSVPASIRPILNFDLDQLFDPQRFSDLEQSFSEVVLLNDAFRQLSEERLA